jgi:hypothetical protein
VSIVGDALLGLGVGGTNVRAVLGSAGGQVVSGPVCAQSPTTTAPFLQSSPSSPTT